MTAAGWQLLAWQLFDASGNDLEQLKQLIEDETEATRRPARPLVCSRCRHPICTDAQRIEVAGSHSHTCTNPHGIVYRIGCFSAAPGCGRVGATFSEYSWFTGYRWQVAVCGNCHEHLGWYFHGTQSFYGLIHARLSSEDNG